MHYCENCHLVFPGIECPNCHSAYVRLPEPEDYCMLDTLDSPWFEMLQDLLKDNGIPCVVSPAKANTMSLYFGQSRAVSSLYVPYSRLEEAQQLQKALVDAPEAGL